MSRARLRVLIAGHGSAGRWGVDYTGSPEASPPHATWATRCSSVFERIRGHPAAEGLVNFFGYFYLSLWNHLFGRVVVKNVDPYTLVAGNPAVKKRDRARDVRYRLDYRRPFH